MGITSVRLYTYFLHKVAINFVIFPPSKNMVYFEVSNINSGSNFRLYCIMQIKTCGKKKNRSPEEHRKNREPKLSKEGTGRLMLQQANYHPQLLLVIFLCLLAYASCLMQLQSSRANIRYF